MIIASKKIFKDQIFRERPLIFSSLEEFVDGGRQPIPDYVEVIEIRGFRRIAVSEIIELQKDSKRRKLHDRIKELQKQLEELGLNENSTIEQ